jgi:hypothetical protein
VVDLGQIGRKLVNFEFLLENRYLQNSLIFIDNAFGGRQTTPAEVRDHVQKSRSGILVKPGPAVPGARCPGARLRPRSGRKSTSAGFGPRRPAGGPPGTSTPATAARPGHRRPGAGIGTVSNPTLEATAESVQ